MGETRKLAAILVADEVGYSRLADAGKGPQRELFRCKSSGWRKRANRTGHSQPS